MTDMVLNVLNLNKILRYKCKFIESVLFIKVSEKILALLPILFPHYFFFHHSYYEM